MILERQERVLLEAVRRRLQQDLQAVNRLLKSASVPKLEKRGEASRRGFKRTAKPRPAAEHIIVENALPVLVARNKFDEVQRIIAEQGHVAPATKGSVYLLSGLARCECCGGRMYGYTNDSHKDDRVYRYYRCNNHISKGSSICAGNTIDADLLETLVIGELKKLGLNPQLVLERTDEYAQRFSTEVIPLRNKESLLTGKLRELERRALNLIELYEQTMITKEEFTTRRNSLDSEKRSVDSELMNVRTELAASELGSYDIESVIRSLRNLGEVYDQLEFAERRELLQSVLDSITVGKHTVTYNVFSLPGVVVDSDRTLTLMPNGQIITFSGIKEPIKIGLLRAMIRKAGLTEDEFAEDEFARLLR
jgi:hypothetical protein